MILVYADNEIIYDSRLEDYALLGLTVTEGENKAGTAEFILPPGHPAYDAFTLYKTLVMIYRDDTLLFRGRALYPNDDFLGNRTITCEGERGFMNDSVMRPYIYQTDPATIFRGAIKLHNAQVDPFKRFVVGKITVTDPNDYQYISCESLSTTNDVIDKLLEYQGGYLMFDFDDEGQRRINWLVSHERQSGQTIEFGANLLDYSRSDSNPELATVIVPYGAKDEETGEYVNITSVNNGLDYIQDDVAVRRYGAIVRPVYWDNVTVPKNLLKKAQQYLATCTQPVSTLELSAVDLSVVNKSIDSFRVGDWVRVVSKPHGLNDLFLLRERSYNLLDPAQDKVVFGKEVPTLTRNEAASAKAWQSQIERAQQAINADLNKANAELGTELRNEIASIYSTSTAGEGLYINKDGLTLQWGSFSAKSGTTLVFFPQVYADAPAVFVTLQGGTPSQSFASYAECGPDSVAIIFSGNANATTVHWLAVGYKGN